MPDEPDSSPHLPPWATDDAFPPSPGGYGWMDDRGRRHSCQSAADLARQTGDGGGAVFLVWTPEQARMCPPEEIKGLEAAIETARKRGIREDVLTAGWRLRWFGTLAAGVLGWQWFQGFLYAGSHGLADPGQRAVWAARQLLASASAGMVLLMFLIFALIPWYQANKAQREFNRRDGKAPRDWLPEVRFDSWLHLQRAPVTRFMIGVLIAVWAAQIWCDHSVMEAGASIQAAGLVKDAYLRGAWWRLFTGPMLHGGALHFLLNAASLFYLGKRVESLARWPHLLLVFVFSAWVGAEASARLVPSASVGVSGGLMGLLGFLIVFETLHGNLVPRPCRRRLMAGVLLTGVIGLLGYRFIDNAAHAAGLVAGMVYATIVFPRSESSSRPAITLTDRVAGGGALAVFLASASLAVYLVLSAGK